MFTKTYQTGPIRGHCQSPWLHEWFDDAPHKINPHNQAKELCVQCMVVLNMGPELGTIDRIVGAQMGTGEFKFWCLVDGCGWMGQYLPAGKAEGEDRARLHAITHEQRWSGARILTGEPEKMGGARYGQMPGDDWDYEGGEV